MATVSASHSGSYSACSRARERRWASALGDSAWPHSATVRCRRVAVSTSCKGLAARVAISTSPTAAMRRPVAAATAFTRSRTSSSSPCISRGIASQSAVDVDPGLEPLRLREQRFERQGGGRPRRQRRPWRRGAPAAGLRRREPGRRRRLERAVPRGAVARLAHLARARASRAGRARRERGRGTGLRRRDDAHAGQLRVDRRPRPPRGPRAGDDAAGRIAPGRARAPLPSGTGPAVGSSSTRQSGRPARCGSVGTRPSRSPVRAS